MRTYFSDMEIGFEPFFNHLHKKLLNDVFYTFWVCYRSKCFVTRQAFYYDSYYFVIKQASTDYKFSTVYK